LKYIKCQKDCQKLAEKYNPAAAVAQAAAEAARAQEAATR